MEKTGHQQHSNEVDVYDNVPGYWDNNKYFEFNPETGDRVDILVEDTQLFDTAKYNQHKYSPYDATCIARFQRSFRNLISNYGHKSYRIVLFLMFVGYTVYFAFAIKTSLEGATVLIVLTSLTVFFIVYGYIRDTYGEKIYKNVIGPIVDWLSSHWGILRWFVIPALLIGVILYVSIEVIRDIHQLQSLSGMVVFVLLLYMFSRYPNQIRWRPIVVGFALQFIMAVLVLRTQWGFSAVRWLSNQITGFINYAMEGAAIVFGNPTLLMHPFVFTMMPMLIYIGAVMSMLYYSGITQLIAAKLGWFVQVTMGTTAIESLSMGANIFLNGMDTMLMLRHYIDKLTASEFHCFLVSGHATVAGVAFAMFVEFGAPPQDLLSAAVMSAPAAIAVCKLNYPETEESITKTQEDVQLEKGNEANVIEAAVNGAVVAGKMVGAVVVNYIGFMSILAFINATLSYAGGRVGYPELSFQVMCSYLFFPMSMIMGINLDECQEVAKLVGLKIFTSEMLAYQELGVSVSKGLLSPRSASITTYALCGFSSLSTLAIAVGIWNSVCPKRTQMMSNQLPRVIINANISCFLTACVAGLMYDPSMETASKESSIITALLELIPDYKVLWDFMPAL